MHKKTFRVITRLSIRTAPGLSGTRLKDPLPVDTWVDVDPASRREVDGYIWWRHSAGWSAEGKSDGSATFMELVSEADLDDPPNVEMPTMQSFRVLVRLSVRTQPSLNAIRLNGAELQPGQVIEVNADSRRLADGYIWWRHSTGWSAEGKSDGSTAFMERITVEPEPESPEETTPPPPPETTDPPVSSPPTTITFKVVKLLSIRELPGLSGRRLSNLLSPGTVITVEAASRTERDGYIWWHHDAGWSAEGSVDGSFLFLDDPGAVVPENPDGSLNADGLPQRDELISRLPVDPERVRWVQYFGNTVFAFESGWQWNYVSFAQGLHSGLDFGNSNPAGIPVFAGINGVFVRNDGFGLAVRSGEYIVIYQHCSITGYTPGGLVSPDTVIGTLDRSLGSNAHLHLEVRYANEKWIINPLLMMAPALRNAIMTRYSAYDQHFYQDDRWKQWLTPLDQPFILRGGPLIGPMA